MNGPIQTTEPHLTQAPPIQFNQNYLTACLVVLLMFTFVGGCGIFCIIPLATGIYTLAEWTKIPTVLAQDHATQTFIAEVPSSPTPTYTIYPTSTFYPTYTIIPSPQPSSTPTYIEQVAPSPTASIVPTLVPATPTHSPQPTSAPLPSYTPTPTPSGTPAPTNTPQPTTTATLIPFAPITLTGTGDAVVDFDIPKVPAIARVTYDGEGNFSVVSYSETNVFLAQVVNTTDEYEGIVPIGLSELERWASRFEVTASGSWEIRILPLTDAHQVGVPGIISGSGDDVVRLVGGIPDNLEVNASNNESTFSIITYGGNPLGYLRLLINEVGAYTGTVLLDTDTAYLAITADGDWTLEVTHK